MKASPKKNKERKLKKRKKARMKENKKEKLPLSPEELFDAAMLDIEGQEPNRQMLLYARLTCRLLGYIAFKENA